MWPKWEAMFKNHKSIHNETMILDTRSCTTHERSCMHSTLDDLWFIPKVRLQSKVWVLLKNPLICIFSISISVNPNFMDRCVCNYDPFLVEPTFVIYIYEWLNPHKIKKIYPYTLNNKKMSAIYYLIYYLVESPRNHQSLKQFM